MTRHTQVPNFMSVGMGVRLHLVLKVTHCFLECLSLPFERLDALLDCGMLVAM